MNVLFLAFEGGEGSALANLAIKFKAKKDQVFVLSCDHYTVTHTNGSLYRYYESIGLLKEEYGNLEEIYRAVNKLPEDAPENTVDWEHLKQFESKYCQYFSIQKLIALDPTMSCAYHNRGIYYLPINKFILYKYVELLTKFLSQLFAVKHFDCIVSINFQYFVKAAVYTMSKALGKPFFTVASCRIKDYYLLYDNFTIGAPLNIVSEMNRLKSANDACENAHHFINWLREERRPSYTDFEHTLKAMHSQMSLRSRLQEMIWYITRYPKRVFFLNKHYRGFFKRDYFLPGYWAVFRAMVVAAWRKWRYFKAPELNSRKLPDKPFVFFALHLIPESSVLTLSETYDEFECLFQLSKALPIEWEIVVKINPGMLASYDTHPNSYYKKMASLPNVRVVDPLIPGTELVARSTAVASLTGTNLLEGAILNKPGIRWGTPEFSIIDIIQKFNVKPAGDLVKDKQASENLPYYIQACLNLGMQLDIKTLCREQRIGEKSLEYDKLIDLLFASIANALQAK